MSAGTHYSTAKTTYFADAAAKAHALDAVLSNSKGVEIAIPTRTLQSATKTQKNNSTSKI